MKKLTLCITLIICASTLLIACTKQSTVVQNTNTEKHTDSFQSIIKPVDDTITDDNNEDNSNTSNDNTDYKFELKENTVPEYSEDEIEEIEKQYDEIAEPNLVIDENTENDESSIVEKTVIIDGVEYKVNINE